MNPSKIIIQSSQEKSCDKFNFLYKYLLYFQNNEYLCLYVYLIKMKILIK